MLTRRVVIDIISPNLRTRNAVEFALQYQGKGRFELSRGNRPDMVIVDCEKPETLADFRKFRSRFPYCPAVLLLNLAAEFDAFPEEERTGAEFLLVKPYGVKDLLASVDQCLNSSSANRTGGKTSLLSRAGNELSVPGQDDRQDLKVTRILARTGNNISVSGGSSPPNVMAAEHEITEKLPLGFAVGTNKPSGSLNSSANGKTAKTRAPQPAGVAQAGEEAAFPFALASDIDLNDAVAVDRIRLKIDNRLLGHILRAAALQVPAQSTLCLELQDGPSILISPHTEMVAVTGGNMNLLNLAQQNIDHHQVSLSVGAMPNTSFQLTLGLEAFLWKLALYTYRGLLPKDAKVNEPVYLRYWPNLTRFEPTPNAMRISSLWCRQPSSMANIIRMLNIPQKHVFSFYAAASTLGLAGPAIREADSLSVPSFQDEASNNQEIIQRLASKLIFPDELAS